MFDYSNTYTLRVEELGNKKRYYAAFIDGQGIRRETKVTLPVYEYLCQSIKIERNLRRWFERHIEYSELEEETLYSRAISTVKSAEEAMFDKLIDQRIKKAFNNLPYIQKRRFVMYHEFGYSYQEIADIEGRTKMAICYSIQNAERRLMQIINNL